MEQLASHPNVVGIIILSRTDNAIIKANGNIFDGEGGKRYAAAVGSIVKGVADALATCNDGENVSILLTLCPYHNSVSQRESFFANNSIGRAEVHEDTNYETRVDHHTGYA